jgi:hypothetical protein
MKKNLLVVLLCSFFALSCSLNDDSIEDFQQLLPIDTAMLPQTVEVGVAEDILITYNRPTNCHAYNDIYYTKNSNERTVSVISTYFASNGNCTPLNASAEASFRFKAEEAGTYIFKFWQGKDANNEDVYLTYEVEAIN